MPSIKPVRVRKRQVRGERIYSRLYKRILACRASDIGSDTWRVPKPRGGSIKWPVWKPILYRWVDANILGHDAPDPDFGADPFWRALVHERTIEQDRDLFGRSSLVARTHKSELIRKKAEGVIEKLRSYLRSVDTARIPNLRALILEDESLLLEWLLPGRRIGITIAEDAKDSDWYVVSTVPGEISSSGDLNADYASPIREVLKSYMG